MSARVAVAIGAGVVVVGGVAFLVWRGRGADEAGDDVILDHSDRPLPGVSESDEITIGWVNGVPANITLRAIGGGKKLRRDAADKYNAMKAEAARAGLTLTCASAFRTMAEQTRLHHGFVNGLPGFNMAAKPGWSNHQGGLSADISTRGLGYDSPEYKWLSENARRFGFINDVAGEPWHWTFKPTAAALLK